MNRMGEGPWGWYKLPLEKLKTFKQVHASITDGRAAGHQKVQSLETFLASEREWKEVDEGPKKVAENLPPFLSVINWFLFNLKTILRFFLNTREMSKVGRNYLFLKNGIFALFQDLAKRIINLFGGLAERLTVSTSAQSRTNTSWEYDVKNHTNPCGKTVVSKMQFPPCQILKYGWKSEIVK